MYAEYDLRTISFDFSCSFSIPTVMSQIASKYIVTLTSTSRCDNCGKKIIIHQHIRKCIGCEIEYIYCSKCVKTRSECKFCFNLNQFHHAKAILFKQEWQNKQMNKE